MWRIFFAGLAFGFVSLAQAAPGDLDTNFAGTGTLRFGFGMGDDHGRAAAVQADGKLVVGGFTGSSSGGSFALVRYTTNNVLDLSFGQGGKVITPVGFSATLSAVNIQSDGKIVAAGTVESTNNTYEFGLARYNDDGSLDTNFNGNGILTTRLSGNDYANALGIQADGKIVVAGSSNGVLAVLRFNPDSTLDTNFNGNGIAANAFSEYSGANAVLFQSDGKLLVAGHYLQSAALLRFTTNGALDSSFNGTGIAQSPTGGASDSFVASSIAIQPGGITILQPAKILVAGWAWIGNTQQEFLVVRYNFDGTLDTSFGGTGYVTTSLGLTRAQGQVVLSQGFGLQPRKIVLAGFGSLGSQTGFVLARFTSSGAFDTSFGGTGEVFTQISNGADRAYGMVGQGGDLVVVGDTTPINSDGDFATVHYHANDGSLDTNYNSSGITIQDISDVPAYGSCVGIQADGKIVVAGYAYGINNQVSAIARLNPDGSPDPTFGSNGKFTFSLGTQGGVPNALAIQTDGRIVLAGQAYGAFQSFFVARLATNGLLDTSFGTNGVVITSFNTDTYAEGVALQSDGKIVVVGTVYTVSGSFYGVARYQPNGSLDTSFHSHGMVVTEIGTDGDNAAAVAIQPDGKIVVTGGSSFGSLGYFSMERYDAFGNFDLAFGSLGRVASRLSGGIYEGSGCVVLQPDGRIVLAGGFYTGTNSDVLTMRFNPNGTLDTNFNGGGQAIAPGGPLDNYAVGVAVQSNGKIVLGASVAVGTNERFAALRYNPNGSLDSSYGAGGVLHIDFGTGTGELCSGMSLDATERAVLVGNANSLFGVARVMGDTVLKIRSISRLPNGHMLLQGSGVANATHTLQSSPNPRSTSFSTLATVAADAGGLWQYEDATVTGSNVRFYRLSYP